jgi:23S rRNA (adenine2503-C2)-methyltransferase
MKEINHQPFEYSNTSDWDTTTFQPVADVKVTLELSDKKVIECAGFKIVHPTGIEMHACISTQAGCKFDCQMCVSGKNGFSRNLSKDEILEQISHLATQMGIEVFDHIVFMGIGEPLDNYDNFVSALRDLFKDSRYHNKLSFATVGIPKMIDFFAQEMLPIRMLWLSLHAPNDELRKIIMPIAKKFTLQETIDAGVRFNKSTGKEVRVNYLLYQGFNDKEIHASELALLLKDTENNLVLQLTEPNGTEFDQYLPGTKEDIVRFHSQLISCGLKNKVMRFLAAGKPVSAGCGEFVYTPNI